MSTILDIHNPWRDALLPASFRNAHFHVASGSRSNGRRIVTHEFPKKDLPYAEDMGRHAKSFSVRAYCITYPYSMQGQGLELYNTDYRVARNILINALEQLGPGTLQLPTLPAENVVASRYNLTEEERFGGYCVFDIEFIEFGVPPQYYATNTLAAVNAAANAVRQQAISTGSGASVPGAGTVL